MEKDVEENWREWDEGGGEESRFLAQRKDKPIQSSVNKPRPLSEND